MLTRKEIYEWCCKHRKELECIHICKSVGENLTYAEYKGSGSHYIIITHWNIDGYDGSAQYINKKLVYTHGNYKPCLAVKIQ